MKLCILLQHTKERASAPLAQLVELRAVFSDKDYKPEVPSHNPCALTLWDVKEPTYSSQRVGHGVPGVVV